MHRHAMDTRNKVRCTGGTNQGIPQPCRNVEIIVKVVDLCPGCRPNQLDLSQQAFSKIANPDAGRIRMEFSRGLIDFQGTRDVSSKNNEYLCCPC
ncbi:EG45-like domain containing protein [Orobanche minor]